MKTAILKAEGMGIEQAAAFIAAGELVAFPTETVWGLGADVYNEKALAKIFSAKNRAQDNPLIVHIASLSQIEELACSIPMRFYDLAQRYFPGPLTLILKKNARVPYLATGGLDSVAIRMPKHSTARKLIEACGVPLAAPSANLSGKPSSTEIEHVLEDFDGRIAAIVEGESSEIGIESTVLSLAHPKPLLLRPGLITLEELEDCLGSSIERAGEGTPLLSPGMKYRHYAPQAKIHLFTTQSELDTYQKKCKTRTRKIEPCAKTLYRSFRLADREGIEEILILCDERIQADVSLYNRLQKAASIVVAKS